MIVIHHDDDLLRITSQQIRFVVQDRLQAIRPRGTKEEKSSGYLMVLEPGDSAADIERISGVAVLQDAFGETRFGDEDFSPAFEVVEEHSDCYELGFVLNDDGFAVVVIIPKVSAMDTTLLRLCSTYASPPSPSTSSRQRRAT